MQIGAESLLLERSFCLILHNDSAISAAFSLTAGPDSAAQNLPPL